MSKLDSSTTRRNTGSFRKICYTELWSRRDRGIRNSYSNVQGCDSKKLIPKAVISFSMCACTVKTGV